MADGAHESQRTDLCLGIRGQLSARTSGGVQQLLRCSLCPAFGGRLGFEGRLPARLPAVLQAISWPRGTLSDWRLWGPGSTGLAASSRCSSWTPRRRPTPGRAWRSASRTARRRGTGSAAPWSSTPARTWLRRVAGRIRTYHRLKRVQTQSHDFNS